MTTIGVTRSLRPATALDRTILRTSAALERYVAQRLERRAASVRPGGAIAVQDAAAQARAHAQALGAIGILPR